MIARVMLLPCAFGHAHSSLFLCVSSFSFDAKLQDRVARRQSWRVLPLPSPRLVARGVLGLGSNKDDQLKLQIF